MMPWVTQAGLTRRRVIACGAGAGLAALLGDAPRLAAVAPLPPEIDAVLGGRAAERSDRVVIDLPSRINYGNTVPLTVGVAGDAGEGAQTVHVFADGNPFPDVVRLHFPPGGDPAHAATRIRLESGRHRIWAVALAAGGGAALINWRDVETAISGCDADSGIPPGYAPPPPRPRIKAPARAVRDTVIEVRSMITHLMESGLRVDTAGNPLPRRIIHRIECHFAGREVLVADLSPAVAANAYLSFPLRARDPGVIELAWHEDGGAVYRAEQQVVVED